MSGGKGGGRVKEVPVFHGGAGQEILARAVLQIITANSSSDALTKLIRTLYILPREVREKALNAIEHAMPPEEEIKEIERAVRDYDISESEADAMLREVVSHYKLQAGLAAISDFLFYVLFSYSGKRLIGE